MAILSRVADILRRLPTIVVLAMIGSTLAIAQIDEYEMKAAFLYNFAKFVEWPPNSFHRPDDPFVICILGQDPFEAHLAGAIQGKLFAGRPFAVRLISGFPSKSVCQILFINSTDRQRFRSIAGELKGSGVLSVGEAPWFIDDGGVINFKLENGKIRFEISVEAATQAHLTISSRLLSLAQTVRK